MAPFAKSGAQRLPRNPLTILHSLGEARQSHCHSAPERAASAMATPVAENLVESLSKIPRPRSSVSCSARGGQLRGSGGGQNGPSASFTPSIALFRAGCTHPCFLQAKPNEFSICICPFLRRLKRRISKKLLEIRRIPKNLKEGIAPGPAFWSCRPLLSFLLLLISYTNCKHSLVGVD